MDNLPWASVTFQPTDYWNTGHAQVAESNHSGHAGDAPVEWPIHPFWSVSDASGSSACSSLITRSDEDEEADEEEYYQYHGPWRLTLPINGGIAQRRALDREQDLEYLWRQQKCQLHHEIELKNGPLNNVDTTFGAVDFGSFDQPYSKFVKAVDGEPVSPKTIPTWEQMSFKEKMVSAGECNDIDVDGDATFLLSDSDDGLEEEPVLTPAASAPSTELYFLVDPYLGRRAST